MIVANINGKKSPAAKDPLGYLFGDIDASDRIRKQKPELVWGDPSEIAAYLDLLRMSGYPFPFLHVSFAWGPEDSVSLDPRIRNRIPRDYLERLTDRPAVDTGHLVVEHGPGELHLVALTADLATAKPGRLYVHDRDAVRMRVWQKEKNVFHGWADPDAIPRPGLGNLILDERAPEHHALARRIHELVETERADGNVSSRQDIVTLIENQNECKTVKWRYSSLTLEFQDREPCDLRGKCYSCAYDADLILAERRAFQARAKGAVSEIEYGTASRVGAGRQSSPSPGERGLDGEKNRSDWSINHSDEVEAPATDAIHLGEFSRRRSWDHDSASAAEGPQPLGGFLSAHDVSPAGASYPDEADVRASPTGRFDDDDQSLPRKPSSGRVDTLTSHNLSKRVGTLQKWDGSEDGPRASVSGAETNLLQAWSLGHFDHFPEREGFFAQCQQGTFVSLDLPISNFPWVPQERPERDPESPEVPL